MLLLFSLVLTLRFNQFITSKRPVQCSLDKIPALDELAPPPPSRRNAAETVFLDEFTVTDEPRWNSGYRPVRAVHADHELVVRNGFVDEATPRCVDRDKTRLGSVER